MNRLLLLFALFIYAVSSESCVNQNKKGKPDIRVIELDVSGEESNESEVGSLQFSSRRRREDVNVDSQKAHFCRSDDDCDQGFVCSSYLTCMKGTWRTVDSLEAIAKN